MWFWKHLKYLLTIHTDCNSVAISIYSYCYESIPYKEPYVSWMVESMEAGCCMEHFCFFFSINLYGICDCMKIFIKQKLHTNWNNRQIQWQYKTIPHIRNRVRVWTRKNASLSEFYCLVQHEPRSLRYDRMQLR